MLGNNSIKKILKKYKNRSIKGLSTTEREEVLKLMDQNMDREAINLFVQEDDGTISSQLMTIPTYFSYLQEKQGNMTVAQLIQKLQSD
jgi:succinate dehydrogenase flavin-adding protein (antitoxin of CptAB toxin-antitoxin module)